MAALPHSPNQDSWPELPLAAWQDTYATLHMWTQIVGKVRLVLSPRINHWWEVPLYVSARGLTTSAIPYGDGIFEIQFDFIEHRLIIQSSWGASKTMALKPRSVADFYAEFMSALRSLGIEVKIWTMPSEVPNPVRFRAAIRNMPPMIANMCIASGGYWFCVDTIFNEFRAGFMGKDSPCIFSGEASTLRDTLFRAARSGRGRGRFDYARGVFA